MPRPSHTVVGPKLRNKLSGSKRRDAFDHSADEMGVGEEMGLEVGGAGGVAGRLALPNQRDWARDGAGTPLAPGRQVQAAYVAIADRTLGWWPGVIVRQATASDDGGGTYSGRKPKAGDWLVAFASDQLTDFFPVPCDRICVRKVAGAKGSGRGRARGKGRGGS